MSKYYNYCSTTPSEKIIQNQKLIKSCHKLLMHQFNQIMAYQMQSNHILNLKLMKMGKTMLYSPWNISMTSHMKYFLI